MTRRQLVGLGGLRLRVAAALAIVGVVLPGIGLIWSRAEVDRALTRQVQQGELATAESLASEIQVGVDSAEAVVRSAARQPGLVTFLQAGDTQAVHAALENIAGTATLFSRLAVVDPSGATVAVQPPGAPDPGPGVVGDGASAMLPARSDGSDAVLPVRERVGPPDAPPLAVLYAEISFTKAAPGTARLRFGRTGRATIVDTNGFGLLSGEPLRAGTPVHAGELQQLVRQWRAGVASYFSPILSRDEVAAFAPVVGRPWGVLVTQSRSEALAGGPGLTRGFFAGLAGVAALGLAVALVAGRAAGTYERRLRSELGEQRRLSEALEVFSSRLAHDLKDPLATARMTAEVAASKTALDDDDRRLLAAVIRQLTRATDLVDDILDLARASGSPRLERLDLRALVEEVAAAVPTALTYAPMPPFIVADRVLVRQALVNLLANAHRYGRTGDAGADVTMGCTESAEGWTLWVADRGPGLADSDVEAVFRPLERGRRAPDVTGTGLGLAIVAAAAAAHGGRAWYEPRPGGGAVFSFLVPRARPTENDADGTAATRPLPSPVQSEAPAVVPTGVASPRPRHVGRPGATGRPPGGFTVIVVDDVADVRHVVRRVLEEQGPFRVVAEAADGAEALPLVAELRPDLVLLDIAMPVGGLEVLPAIREAAPETKVVVLSSYPKDVMAPAALSGGAVGYLEKGLPPHQLVDEVLTVAGLLELIEASIMDARTSLAADPSSAGAARRFVGEVLDRWDCGELLDLVTLLVSELVTNAVVHAGTDVDVGVRLLSGVVRIEVADRDPTSPVPRDAAVDESSGRGLALVEALASRWGVDRAEDRPGKTLWFEVARPGLAGSS